MPGSLVPPFSSRHRGPNAHIDNDVPESARNGLLHLLHDLVDKGYVRNWGDIARELQRLVRDKPLRYAPNDLDDMRSATIAAERILMQMPWPKVFDFVERLHSHLSQEVSRWDSFSGEAETVLPRSEVQAYMLTEIRRLFLEEHLAFEFADGVVRRRGRRHSIDQMSRADVVLGDPRLTAARKHYTKALRYFQNPSQPDPENAVKEAVCAVEAAARALFPESAGKTLGDSVKALTGGDVGKLPKAIAQTFHGLYGFRSGGEGVGHGGAEGGPATLGIAEYSLAVAASQIILLVDLANAQESDVPF